MDGRLTRHSDVFVLCQLQLNYNYVFQNSFLFIPGVIAEEILCIKI